MQPVVSIVIPTYNAGPALKETIEACVAQDYPDDRLEVVIVDDGSTDETASLVSGYPVTYIYQENRGPAAARNRGWRAAKGEIVCFTDSDCVPEREWVKKLVEWYTFEDVGGVGGSYGIRNPSSPLANLIHREILARHKAMPRYVSFLGSFNVSYRRRTLEEVEGFDESFRHASGEDNDLSYKVLKAEHRLVFVRDARVAHLHTERLRKYLREQYRHGYWRVKLYMLHPDMMAGDNYSGLSDFIPPVLTPLVVLFAIAGAFWRPALYVSLILVFIMLSLNVRVLSSIEGDAGGLSRPFALSVIFLRSFARGFGLIKGVIDFMIKPRLRPRAKAITTNRV